MNMNDYVSDQRLVIKKQKLKFYKILNLKTKSIKKPIIETNLKHLSLPSILHDIE